MHKDGEVKYKAGQVSHLLDEHFREYEVIPNDSKIKNIISEFSLDETPDNIILASAYSYNNISPIIVCTDELKLLNLFQRIFLSLQQKV